ncbi:PREDICTED: uncharacterized protein LOC106117769 [Papilio xuthus]|uniref:Uncharacterized protein LOC106117769 n=2 Tax=Papilio xuthus TaxID=66420 RepID=A0AAJ6Z931_PAPXU|nr:PREDICTED: uncharacterized protein LOC106117769 [Papilio xuthus]
MTFCLDVEMFISEVKKYPVIWDANCEDNNHKTRKQRAWTHIARMLITDFDDLPEHEKAEVDKKLQCKWRNIKDSYVRDLRKKDGKRYMYSKFLTFLDNRYKKQDQSGSEADSKEWNDETTPKHKRLAGKRKRFETLSESNWASDSEEVPSTIDNLKRRRVPENKDDDERNKIDFVNTPFPDPSCSYTVEDEDRSFFDSLLPVVREFNVDQKLEFRSEVLRLIKEFRHNRLKSTL